MAIQPQFAQAILNGSKRIEFRKRRLASDINTVLIYESAPTQRIVGHFTIERTELATPPRLWRSYGPVGSIRRADYLDYFGDSRQAVGLLIKASERYARPVALDELNLRPAVPQSFSYLPQAVLSEILALQQGPHPDPPDRLAASRCVGASKHEIPVVVRQRLGVDPDLVVDDELEADQSDPGVRQPAKGERLVGCGDLHPDLDRQLRHRVERRRLDGEVEPIAW